MITPVNQITTASRIGQSLLIRLKFERRLLIISAMEIRRQLTEDDDPRNKFEFFLDALPAASAHHLGCVNQNRVVGVLLTVDLYTECSAGDYVHREASRHSERMKHRLHLRMTDVANR